MNNETNGLGVTLDSIQWEKHSTTSVIFLQKKKMHNLDPVMKNIGQLQIEAHSKTRMPCNLQKYQWHGIHR